MKKLYSSLCLSLLLISFSARSQSLEFLNANNVNAGIGVGGNLFSLSDSAASSNSYWNLFEAPKGSGRSSIFTASLWMSAHDPGGATHCAAQRYNQNGHDYFDEPIANTYNNNYDNYYERVFKITKNQIEHHKSLPTNPFPGNIDSSILFWPAIGNPAVALDYGVRITSPLASFIDINHDGIYDAAKGDYPEICGDEAIFFVFNDDRFPHTESNGAKLGFEIRGLANVFYDSTLSPSKAAINNTVFVSYEIENKSHMDFKDFYLSLWEDVEIGCFANDRVGCDTVRDMFFGYNGSTPDQDCQSEKGYAPFEVSQGAVMLNREMSAFGYFTNGAVFSQQDPGSCGQYRAFATGYWADGTPFTNGGTGYNSGGGYTKFMFPGDLNDPNQWSEIQPQVSDVLRPGDRRVYGSIGPMDFNQGEVKHFDFAFLVSYDSTATFVSIVDTLKRDADIIQHFYDNAIVPCKTQIFAGVNDMQTEDVQLLIQPNPASGSVTIKSFEVLDEIIVSDLQGKIVSNKSALGRNTVLDVSTLTPNVYLLTAKVNGKSAVKKLVIY